MIKNKLLLVAVIASSILLPAAVRAQEDIIGGREVRLSSVHEDFSQLGDTSSDRGMSDVKKRDGVKVLGASGADGKNALAMFRLFPSIS